MSSCNTGYQHLKNRDYQSGIDALSSCAEFLEVQDPSDYSLVIQTHYLLARSYYAIDNFGGFATSAQNVEDYTMLASLDEGFTSPLKKSDIDFLRNETAKLDPIHRTNTVYQGAVVFTYSESDGCDFVGHDHYSQLDPEYVEFEKCENKRIALENSASYAMTGTTNLDATCRSVLDKADDCLVLYCFNGSYQNSEPAYETGPRKLECDSSAISFHNSSPDDQLNAFLDLWTGPIDYELSPEEKITPPELSVNPYGSDEE